MPAKFDLQKAIAGEPIQTRDGRKARFIAHVPESARPVIAYIDGYSLVSSTYEDGTLLREMKEGSDLVMAPRKRPLWVRVYQIPGEELRVVSADCAYSPLFSRGPPAGFLPGTWVGFAVYVGEVEIGEEDA